jgi:hypothetical protein
MRSFRLLGIAGPIVCLSLAGLSLAIHPAAQAQTSGVAVSPEGEKVLEAFAEAARPGAPSTALKTWATAHNATVSTIAPGKTTVKAPLTFLSSSTAIPESPSAGVEQVSATCKYQCPSYASGSYVNKRGYVVDYTCSGLKGCSYDATLKKWRCTYSSCEFNSKATVIPR